MAYLYRSREKPCHLLMRPGVDTDVHRYAVTWFENRDASDGSLGLAHFGRLWLLLRACSTDWYRTLG
jgi:hypothetical protein